jgi:hypothetical protein
MLQIVKNIIKEGKLNDYIEVAKQFTSELDALVSVNFSKVYVEAGEVYIVIDWIEQDPNSEMVLFLKYKSKMKPLFISNESIILKEV